MCRRIGKRHESHFILPAAHRTLYPSNNTAGVSFLLRHTFSIFSPLSWFSEDERDKFYNT